MASTVEQCENKPLGTLASTLEMFDTFKSQDDDKDSDEESFHLPLLGCDDDAENGKEDRMETDETEDDILNKFETAEEENVSIDEPSNDNEMDQQSVPEAHQDSKVSKPIDSVNESLKTSEDIEKNIARTTPDNIETENENSKTETEDTFKGTDDKHTEDLKLKTDEDIDINKDMEESGVEYSAKLENKDVESSTNASVTEEVDSVEADDLTEGNGCEKDNDAIDEADIKETKNEEKDTDVAEVEKVSAVEESTDVAAVKEDSDVAVVKEATDVAAVDDDTDAAVVEEAKDIAAVEEDRAVEKATDAAAEDETTETAAVEEDIDMADIEKAADVAAVEDAPDVITSKDTNIKSSSDVSQNSIEDKDCDNSAQHVNDGCDKNETLDRIENDTIKGNNKTLDKDVCDDTVKEKVTNLNGPLALEEEKISDSKENTSADLQNAENTTENENASEKIDESVNTNSCTKEIVENINEDDQTINKKPNSEDMDVDKNVNNEPDGDICMKDDSENAGAKSKNTDSKDGGKTHENASSELELEDEESSKPIECEDLLDISVIRDADEDNASAIAEIADTHSSEKSDNDEQDDKGENDEEMEVDQDQDDTSAPSDKDETVDFDEGNTNSCDQDMSNADNMISAHTSDSENKENETTETEQSESETHILSVDDLSEINSNQDSIVDADSTTDTNLDDTLKQQDVDEAPDNSEESNEAASVGKRPLSDGDVGEVASKKMKISKDSSLETKEEPKKSVEEKKKLAEERKKSAEEKKRLVEEKKKSAEEKKKTVLIKSDKIKTLTTFENFMKNRNLGDGKLTRSDLEQFCLQKICEALVHKTETGELHQIIKKQEQIIDNLRKDLQQLSKQTRDLDIVNKKLMTELRTQNINQKPLVPLKITRSVGLQVKLNISAEPVARRKTVATSVTPNKTPTTPTNTTAPTNRARTIQPASNVVRQVAPQSTTTAASPRKPPTAPILSQALQTRPVPTLAALTPPATVKRPPLMRVKPGETQKPSAPGVIDLTDEDEKTNKPAAANNVQQKPATNKLTTPVKIVNKNVNLVQNKNAASKVAPQKLNSGQQKTVAVGASQVGTKINLPARAVTTIPQSVRLTPTQMKNGITIPASVVTSSAGGTTQLMYVVQPTGTANSTSPNVQKAVLLNFQPTNNGVLASTINGSAVSVIPSKTTSTAQFKNIVPAQRKHPAPLPHTPQPVSNSSLKPLLPKPHLSIKKTDTGIILQWRMPYNLDTFEAIASYQLFAYQETNAAPSTDMWRKVGDVKALALPMACTLTQFADKNKYYFAVRSVDVHKRIGAFSDPEEISL